jgi:hypothetical protein
MTTGSNLRVAALVEVVDMSASDAGCAAGGTGTRWCYYAVRSVRRTGWQAGRNVRHPARTVERLQQARLVGPQRYRTRPAELDVLSAPKIADLLIPVQVVLRLAVAGSGVVPPPE